MTVKELKELLHNVDDNLVVCVPNMYDTLLEIQSIEEKESKFHDRYSMRVAKPCLVLKH